MWDEVLVWTILSAGSVNLMTTFFTYFLVSHPIIVLSIYFLVYYYLAKYLLNLGTLLKYMELYQYEGDGSYDGGDDYHLLSPTKLIHP